VGGSYNVPDREDKVNELPVRAVEVTQNAEEIRNQDLLQPHVLSARKQALKLLDDVFE